jgi:hypothetical protein
MILRLKEEKVLYATLPESFENYKKFWLADKNYDSWNSGAFYLDGKVENIFLVLDSYVLKPKLQKKINKTKIFLKLLFDQNIFWVVDDGFEKL